MKNKTILATMLMLATSILLFSCAQTHPEIKQCVTGTHVCGFWHGLWHGIIAPFSFIGSLFSDNIAVWNVNNNGGWYTFGFVLGVGALTGGSSKV